MLGKREPEIYGSVTFEDYFTKLQFEYKDTELSYFQSNMEGALISKLHEANDIFDGVILNGAAYTHTSVGLGDAVAAISVPVIEVHISNTFAREEFRHHSYVSKYAEGIIVGFGLKSYKLAIEHFLMVA